jgi:CheY-like chemotaxis protein
MSRERQGRKQQTASRRRTPRTGGERDRSAPVLVVEGDPLVASLIGSQLELANVGSLIVFGAAEGLEAMEGRQVRAAIIELRLPGRDGWWLVARVRELASRTPIVVITGLADPHVVERAADARCTLLVKPFSAGDLAQKLADAARLMERVGNPHPTRLLVRA